MPRNPNWTRDELILALDLYFQVNVAHVSHADPKVVKLSELLNSLDLHGRGYVDSDFRNANGVYMKLCNFLRLDPNYPGVGLQRGSKLEETIWNDFAHKREHLAATAEAIRENAEVLAKDARAGVTMASLEDEDFVEGRLLERLHKSRERSPRLIKRKKEQVLGEQGKLACEVCGFDFEMVYGELGSGFAECHHLIPLVELRYGTQTKLSDLAIVCANCHRMVHRGHPMLSIDELRAVTLH